jgi:putative hemolysin
MLLPGILLFVLCLLLSAFFSSSETAFIAVNP